MRRALAALTLVALWPAVRLVALLDDLVLVRDGSDAEWDTYARACRRCRHPHTDHHVRDGQRGCGAWDATIPGLPDAEPCACGGFQ